MVRIRFVGGVAQWFADVVPNLKRPAIRCAAIHPVMLSPAPFRAAAAIATLAKRELQELVNYRRIRQGGVVEFRFLFMIFRSLALRASAVLALVHVKRPG